MQNNNSLWQFFASVRLALVIISLLAVTSIIGTVIPQKEAAEFYVNNYGQNMAQIFSVLDIPDMYNSWWFLALLCLLGFNLVICSIDRFPSVWKQVKADGLTMPPSRLEKMTSTHCWSGNERVSEASVHIQSVLKRNGWKPSLKNIQEGVLIFAQKGAWTRTGVYIVHSSILVIFLGAVIGMLGGFKGSIMIPETTQRDKVFLFNNGGIQNLDFAVRCNRFSIELYPNGMPKEYTSSLTILENDKEIITKEIEVNDPLTYKGITFYQSSYEPYQDFVVSITNPETGSKKSFTVPFQTQETWEEEGLKFGIINARAIGQSVVSSKIWLTAGNGNPVSVWADDNKEIPVKTDHGTYLVTAKQMYATGLQVAKDPGVWWVYIGCGLMLFGLYVAFFLSHKRIWLLVRNENNGNSVIFSGTANKNRPGFAKTFENLQNELDPAQSESLNDISN